MQMMMAGMLAFCAEAIGVAIGVILYCLFDIRDKRIIGMMFGATSGIMLAVICFDILPEALSSEHKSLVFISVFTGMVIGIWLQQLTEQIEGRLFPTGSGIASTGIVFLMGIAIHNIPEGFALGTIMASSPQGVIRFALVICLHSIPEAIALTIPLKEGGVSKKTLASIPIILGSVMGISALVGYILSGLTVIFMTISLGLAGGIILYIVCEELLPESRRVWNGRMTSIAIIIGILLGILLVGS